PPHVLGGAAAAGHRREAAARRVRPAHGRARMKSAVPSRRDRVRQVLGDLHMPGALESLDAILHGVDGATLTAAEAIEQLLDVQIQLRKKRRVTRAMR